MSFLKTTIKRLVPKTIIKRHRLHKIKKIWPTCDIRTENVGLDGKCSLGKYVRIPASSEYWGGYMGLFLCRRILFHSVCNNW